MSETIEAMEASWPPPSATPDIDKETLADWRRLVDETRALAIANRWSKGEVARRAEVSNGAFSQWFNGRYKGNYEAMNIRVRRWLDSAGAAQTISSIAARAPGFVPTRSSAEIEQALTYAQMMPEISVITLAAGMGKTMTARRYCAMSPNSFIATMSPCTRAVHGMLAEIGAALGLSTRSTVGLHRLIGERLARAPNTLLIIDEAQNLTDEAVNQARTFLDLYDCGIALVGNEEIYSRFERKTDGPSYAQIRGRFGKRLRRTAPYREDVDAIIDAWRVEDDGARKLLTGIGLKPGGGGLRQIDKTMRLAAIIAAGADKEGGAISERHVRAAWKNRGMEGALC